MVGNLETQKDLIVVTKINFDGGLIYEIES